jgi:DNA adenine methylase|tara:strand:+ start:2427 stop:3341 length:915 start_codon:yes stop_codon:yes gene_type:complete
MVKTTERRKYPTVLRYPGGKSRIIYYLFRKNMLPENVKEYREGFLGGGSCALAFSVMYPDVPVWVNDLYYNLFAFWTQLQKNPDPLINRLLELKDEACRAEGVEELEKKHRALYADMRDLINTSDDDFDLATAFYVLNRSSFGGFTEQNKNAFIRDSYKNTIFSQSKIKKLANISQIIQPWRITNQDYRDLMEGPGEDVFVFLDPPYLIKDMLYGKDKEMHTSFCHEAFVKSCKDTPHNWMITYNEHPWLREQFADFHMENFEFRYSLAHRKENKNKKEELLVMNYQLPRDFPKNNVIEDLLYA